MFFMALDNPDSQFLYTKKCKVAVNSTNTFILHDRKFSIMFSYLATLGCGLVGMLNACKVHDR